MNTCAILAVKTVKNTDSNALFSCITATTESLILGVNSFKRDFDNRTICEHFCRGGTAGGRGELGLAPENYTRAIRPDYYNFASYGPDLLFIDFTTFMCSLYTPLF